MIDALDRRFTDAQLDAVRDRNSVAAVAGQWVTLRPKRAGEYVGPCPICSTNDSASAARFECDADKWVCAVCGDGGDVIRLVQKREGIGFVAAVERLGGARPEEITELSADRAGRKAFRAGNDLSVPLPYSSSEAFAAAYVAGWRKGEAAAKYAAGAREKERRRLFNFWRAADRSIVDTAVERYLAGRGLQFHAGAFLRHHPAMPLFADGREREPLLVHKGPAMLAAIRGADDRFSGLHITWLDPRGPKGKAAVRHPETGELLPSKKVRGTKAGGYIDLGGDGAPVRVIAGEGVETVLAAYTALRRSEKLRAGDCFRSAIDLGNLAGKALESVRHPTLKDAAGRVRKVPGLEPDLSSSAMPVPLTARSLILLGDGDSDPFTTDCAMKRAAARHARDGLLVRVHTAPAGLDFNDVVIRPALPAAEMQGVGDGR